MLDVFIAELSENLGLPESTAEWAAKVTLKTLLRRTDKAVAEEVVSLLPEEWRDEFVALGAGLDISITSSTVLGELGRVLAVPGERAQELLPKITLSLLNLVPQEILFKAFSHLPYEMRNKIDIGDERLYIKDLDAFSVQPELPPLHPSTLGPFINKKVVILNDTDSLNTASIAMAEGNVGCVLVKKRSGEWCGVLTDRDLACAASALELGTESAIREAMSDDFVYALSTDGLQTVVNLMIQNGVRRIPILSPSGNRCLGIVTLDDLLATEAISLDQACKIVRQQISPKPHRPNRAAQRATARRQNTLRKFRRHLAQALDLDEERAEEATKIALRAMLCRVTYTEANHLISQLPTLWQDELMELPAGPDKSINAAHVIQQLASYLDIDQKRAAGVFKTATTALGELISRDGIRDLAAQLPHDMQDLIGVRPVSPH